MRYILLMSLCFVFLNFSSVAKSIAIVKKIKGKASMLLPHTLEAVPVVKGAEVTNDTSILTKRRSVVIIEYFDKSKITIGPNSKVVVKKLETMAKGKGVLNLLTGKIRAKIKKSETASNSFYVQSRTAAMGVRGTTFQTTYNAQSQTTSLLTIKGKVAIKKIKSHEVPVKAHELEVALKKAAIVKKGEISCTTPALKMETVPVRISPKQFTMIKINKNFAEKLKISKKQIEKEIKKTVAEFSKTKYDKETVLSKEGKFDKKSRRYHPRSGGYIDTNTGIYVQPFADSKFDEKTKMYKTDKIGTVAANGDYVPPKGLVLSAVKGFVAEGEQDKREVASLNKQISVQMVKPKSLPKSNLDEIDGSDEEAYGKYFDY